MHLKKNQLYKIFFYVLISLIVIFNGGNYDLFSQVNFILISFFLLFCFKNLNYKAHINKFYFDNKKIIIIYLIFLSYLLFQILPLPIDILEFFSPTKIQLLKNLDYSTRFSSISLNPGKSYFILLNYISLILYLIIFKAIFYKERHLLNFYFFLSFLSFIASAVAIYFYLIGNPDFLFIKNIYYSNSSTGFFINRTVFACFLNLGFLSSIEYLNLLNSGNKKLKENYFHKIYIRLFLLFITIGIITSFSRIGNFLLLVLILIYMSRFFLEKKNKNYLIFYTLIAIVLIDILIIGLYFDGYQLIDRFFFLKSELNYYINETNEISSIKRGDIARFSFSQLNKFLFFGYGPGGYEILFKNFYPASIASFANHAHFDIVEFVGEFGLVGSFIITLMIIKVVKKIQFLESKNIYLILFIFLILFFDFSLHIPLIQIILILLFSTKNKYQ